MSPSEPMLFRMRCVVDSSIRTVLLVNVTLAIVPGRSRRSLKGRATGMPDDSGDALFSSNRIAARVPPCTLDTICAAISMRSSLLGFLARCGSLANPGKFVVRVLQFAATYHSLIRHEL